MLERDRITVNMHLHTLRRPFFLQTEKLGIGGWAHYKTPQLWFMDTRGMRGAYWRKNFCLGEVA